MNDERPERFEAKEVLSIIIYRVMLRESAIIVTTNDVETWESERLSRRMVKTRYN